MTPILTGFFSALANGGDPTDFFLGFIALYVCACALILLIDPILE